MKLHIIPNIYIPTYKKHSVDAFTTVCINMCKLFHSNGQHVCFYGVEDAEVECTDFYPIVPASLYDTASTVTNDFTDPAYMTVGPKIFDEIKDTIVKEFMGRLTERIHTTYEEGDIVLHVCATYWEELFSKSMIHIQACHGGGYIYTSNVVFITKQWMDKCVLDLAQSNRTLDNVTNILSPINTNFEYKASAKIPNTFLYLARCIRTKGIHTFLTIAKSNPQYTFWVAGGCSSYDPKTQIMITEVNDNPINLKLYPNVVYWGVVGYKERKLLLMRATVLIQPTHYFEPCGINVIEAALSGVPALTSDRGGFLDTVVNNKTGFHVTDPNSNINNVRKWNNYLDKALSLNPEDCRVHALNLVNADNIYRQYMDFFARVKDNHRSGTQKFA